MNFLEQLAAERYQYNGYFVRTNLRFGRNARGKGGHVGEIDVVAYDPNTEIFIHLESSTDAYSWSKRKKVFEKKFTNARKYYLEIFPFKRMDIKPKQIALVGFNLSPSPKTSSWKSSPPDKLPWGNIKIEVIHIPKFFQDIKLELQDKDPQRNAIPENFPLLRAIQYSIYYQDTA